MKKQYNKILYFSGIFIVWFINDIQADFDCLAILRDPDISYFDAKNIQNCVQHLNDNDKEITQSTRENIWRLIKIAYNGLENVPSSEYTYLGFILTAIPLNDLYNISMRDVEVVEAFGSIRSTFNVTTYTEDQFTLLAHKISQEWKGKTSKTYSEFDLKTLSEILCFMNVSIIADIHPDAFKAASQWIGKMKICTKEHLEAFAKLATHPDAFGNVENWSKLEISLIGNIINGLTPDDINKIDADKLRLNRYYKKNFQHTQLSLNPSQLQFIENNNTIVLNMNYTN